MNTDTNNSASTPRRPPRATEVETYGVDTIAAADRTSKPIDLFRLTYGGANTFATVILGTIPISLGLSFWQGTIAAIIGVVVGGIILMPMSLFGPQTGTNNAVSSGAHFGVHGRLVGSILSLLTAIAFYSISVWVGGDAIMGALRRLAHVPDTDWLRTILYAVIGLTVIVVVIYGYQFMLLVNKIVVIANTVLILLAIFAFWGNFNPSYDPGPSHYSLDTFWPTFTLGVLSVMSNPVSFGGFLGDWSRYIPKSTPRWRLAAAAFLAQLATLIPFLFGVATATIVAGHSDYMVALIQASPAWYAVILIVVAFIGGLSTGTTALYGTGLDFSSVFAKLSRVQATIGIGALAFIFILVGRLLFDLLGAVNAFVGAIVVATTPFMAIMAVGFFTRRGYYYEDDLQVFNRHQVGGRYWFSMGFN